MYKLVYQFGNGNTGFSTLKLLWSPTISITITITNFHFYDRFIQFNLYEFGNGNNWF